MLPNRNHGVNNAFILNSILGWAQNPWSKTNTNGNIFGNI